MLLRVSSEATHEVLWSEGVASEHFALRTVNEYDFDSLLKGFKVQCQIIYPNPRLNIA